MKPHISLIVARSQNGVIGKDGKLPWHFPEELKFFKQITIGKPIIMGRHTWESIGRPLPGRRNVVVTRQPDYKADKAEVVHSLEDAVKLFTPNDNVFIIGGANLYRQALPIVDTAWITEILQDFEGDTTFDSLDLHDWKRVWVEEHPAGESGPWAYRFQRFDRIRHSTY